jgi:hypothetical protein
MNISISIPTRSAFFSAHHITFASLVKLGCREKGGGMNRFAAGVRAGVDRKQLEGCKKAVGDSGLPAQFANSMRPHRRRPGLRPRRIRCG